MLINLTSIKAVKQLLQDNYLRPSKRLGQNFLISKQVLSKVLETAELKTSDTVLEPGPGLGALTVALAQKVKKVMAVEKDKKLTAILSKILEKEGIGNVEVIQGDILKCQMSNVKCQIKPKCQIPKPYKLVANLPYSIATAVVMKFLEIKNPPEVMMVMLQKEVGQRMCGKPPKMSKLGVFCQFYGQPEIVATVSKRAFYPQPRVDSVILKLTPVSRQAARSPHLARAFSRIVRTGFSHPRKQLLNNLSQGLGLPRQKTKKWLTENHIRPNQRAETLTVDNWLQLTKTLFVA